MANQSTGSAAAQVYGGITKQIAGQTPGGASLAKFANVGAGRPSVSYYNSRVRQAKQNGAGPTSDPVNAPWSFSDYAYGTRSMTKIAASAKVTAQPKTRWQQLRGGS